MNGFNESKVDIEVLKLDAEGREARKRFMSFTDEDASELRALLPIVEPRADAIVDAFYANVERWPELLDIIQRAGSGLDRLKAAQRRYLVELFQGEYGEIYFDRRLRIGAVHSRIGLTPQWYLGSYSTYYREITPLIMTKYRFRPGRCARAVGALNKIIALDSGLAMDMYIHGLMANLSDVSMSKGEIEKRVGNYSRFVRGVAEGDLTEDIEIDDEADDLTVLAENLNAMKMNLGQIAGRTREAADDMLSAVSQVQDALSAQSSGAAEQASAVNETTSTLEEIRSTSGQMLEKARQLGEAAEQTQRESAQGREAVDLAITGMDSIRQRVEAIAQTILSLSEQTQQIGEITEVVTNLAQQSKMLALNASIEAAKADEAGKGFAVVAAEVKDLAEQSQQSTAQVQKILQDIRHATDRAVMATEEGSKGVDAGIELVKQTGQAMNKLGEVITQTATASQEIVAAVSQEAVGIDQVYGAMGEISKVTTQFVTSAEQTKQAASSLKQVAGTLTESVSVYKL